MQHKKVNGSLEFPPRNAVANMNASSSLQQRKIFGHLSIVVGNMLQIAGIAAACVALALARFVQPRTAAFAAAMLIVALLVLGVLTLLRLPLSFWRDPSQDLPRSLQQC